MKNINVLLIVLTFLVSCGSLKEAGKVLRNEKTNTTDEFLVKKKQPLVLPPEFDKIPEPGSIKNRNINEKENIKKILKAPKENIKRKNSSNIEKSIIEKIQK
tara:strand:+ start:1974 stop:2279 length:306 start_codon:yes stop_codon:yes gene_type:complete